MVKPTSSLSPLDVVRALKGDHVSFHKTDRGCHCIVRHGYSLILHFIFTADYSRCVLNNVTNKECT